MTIPHEDKSFWLRQYGPYVPEPPLAGDLDADVAVVGAGFTGLSTAFHLRQESPGLRVIVLESHIVGFGASGRNGGFNMTLFGLEPAVTQALFGPARTAEAHRYMERAVDFVRDLVELHQLQLDYEHPGFLRVATTPGFVRRIQHDLEILTKMGIGGIDWWEADRVQEEIHSPCVLGAWWEPRCGLLDPVKHVRELKRLALQAGAVIHEGTPVTGIERGKTFILHTPDGRVRAGRIVLATNAWSHLLAPLKRKQVPAFTHMVVTEPLRPERFDDIGWRHRQGIEDARNLVHYLRLTADQRIAIGGSDVTIAYGEDMERDLNPRVFADLERDLIHLFPPLAGIRFVSRWGGPVSVPIDMAPAIGFVGDRRVVYSLGCVGHGVSLSQLNGRTISDLVLEKQTDLTAVWFVGRRTIPWPPEPIRFAASHAIRGYLRAEDSWYERNAATRD